MRPNLQFPKNFVTFTEEVFITKLHFLCSVSYMSKCFTKFTRFFYRSYLSSYSYFPEFCCDAIKNAHCYQFLCKCLQVSPWKIFRRYCGFIFRWPITFSRNFENNWNKNVNPFCSNVTFLYPPKTVFWHFQGV